MNPRRFNWVPFDALLTTYVCKWASLPEKSMVTRRSGPLGPHYHINHQSEGTRNLEWTEEEGDDEHQLQL